MVPTRVLGGFQELQVSPGAVQIRDQVDAPSVQLRSLPGQPFTPLPQLPGRLARGSRGRGLKTGEVLGDLFLALTDRRQLCAQPAQGPLSVEQAQQQRVLVAAAYVRAELHEQRAVGVEDLLPPLLAVQVCGAA
ncbi:hypothetical protein [Streptomyces sp. NPDC059708]|uniref:hypothetical protein n=1 Tax=Streptomyces sp. NPDC059708 TaxID=3346916 RepID=UPI0036745F4F